MLSWNFSGENWIKKQHEGRIARPLILVTTARAGSAITARVTAAVAAVTTSPVTPATVSVALVRVTTGVASLMMRPLIVRHCDAGMWAIEPYGVKWAQGVSWVHDVVAVVTPNVKITLAALHFDIGLAVC